MEHQAGWLPATGPIACVLLPHFLWQAEAVRRPELRKRQIPVLFTGPSGPGVNQGFVLLDWSPWLNGLVKGMSVDQAVAVHGNAELVRVDVSLAERAFEDVVASLKDTVISDAVEAGVIGEAYVSIRGLEQTFGTDAQLVCALAAAVTGSLPGSDVRIGLGPNKWVSYIAARQSRQGSARKVISDPVKFLSCVPVDVFPVSYELIAQLHTFGLEALGDVAALQSGAMAAQFGPEGSFIWALANGIDPRPFLPSVRIERISRQMWLEHPSVEAGALHAAVELVLAQAFAELTARRMHVRRLEMEVTSAGQVSQVVPISFHSPTGNSARALERVKSKLGSLHLLGPIACVRVTLSELAREAGDQKSLLKDVRQQEHVREVAKQIKATLGAEIFQSREVEPSARIPELRDLLVPLGR